ncbi:alpha/beta-hydrolase [Marasmius fiardii PR-910]|nr:alpha/beta-hydrolase [Marasmius fiardii PR-910]
MPLVSVETRSGRVEFNYHISTPEETSAKTIKPDLPTVLFIHPCYISSIAFHSQFRCAKLRRFNLVALDLRCHGYTTGAPVKSPYSVVEAAEDIVGFMDAALIPPSHIVALSMSTMISFELAISFPERCLSLFQLSPVGLPRTDAFMEGFNQIHDLWREGMVHDDPLMLRDSLDGVKQFSYSEREFGYGARSSALVDATFNLILARGCEIWGPSPEGVEQFNETTIRFFTNSKLRTVAEFEKIRVPVMLVHGGGDLIIEIEYVKSFGKMLDEAGVSWELTVVPHAPHIINSDFGDRTTLLSVNPILHDFVIRSTRHSIRLPPLPKKIRSPWDDMLRDVGYENDSDDEDLIYHRSGK